MAGSPATGGQEVEAALRAAVVSILVEPEHKTKHAGIRIAAPMPGAGRSRAFPA